MIESALNYLAIVISQHFTEITGVEHNFKVIHTDIENSSRSIGDKKSSAISGYIRPTSIAYDDQNRRMRNIKLVVNSGDMTYSMIVFPVRIELEVKVSLYKGHSQIYKSVPAVIMAQSQGACDFSLNIALGEHKIPVSIQVKNDVSMEFPDITTEPEDGEAGLLFSLSMTNVFSILGSSEVPKIIDFDYRTKVRT